MKSTVSYTSEYHIGQRVYVDKDHAIIATVTGIMFNGVGGHSVSISWWANGDLKNAFVEPFRLTPVKT